LFIFKENHAFPNRFMRNEILDALNNILQY